MIERKYKRTARIGVFAVVHEVYFEQFEGLFKSLLGYHKDLIKEVDKKSFRIFNDLKMTFLLKNISVFNYFQFIYLKAIVFNYKIR